MWNSFFLLCVVLLVEGVSGDAAVDVSVLEGDSITLEADNITLKTDDWIRWKFNGTFISKMKKTGEDFIIKNDFDLDKKFIGRLEPNIKTGSLKITDITADHAGLYKAEMKSTTDTSKNYIVTVHGNVKSVSMLEGDSVTLHTGVTKKQGDQIHWKIGNENLNGDADYTITNICQTGHYEVEIHTSSITVHRKFPINCSGGKRTLLEKEEQRITLDTGFLNIQGYGEIWWEFGGQIIAKINQTANQLSHLDNTVKRFKGRLQLNENSGSLTISKTKSTDSGVYHLQMNSRSHTLQRNISVTISVSSGAVSRIYSASFGLVFWAVTLSLLQV